MTDLDDLFYFDAVATHGGFTAAGRVLRIPKSKLSRRVGQLEERLGVRLIERSSRRFRVTDIGQTFAAHARRAVVELERAEAAVAATRTKPRGTVRFSCPTGLIELVAPAIPSFLLRYPDVRVHVAAIDRPVDLVAEPIDVALRVRTALTSDAGLTMRTLAKSSRVLIASPALANTIDDPSDIARLATMPTLSSRSEPGLGTWTLHGPNGETHTIEHEPRLTCPDFIALREAATAGLGVTLLPDHACADALRAGTLARVFPRWSGAEGIVHVVFTTRSKLPAQVRAWLDHLAAHFADQKLFAPVAARG